MLTPTAVRLRYDVADELYAEAPPGEAVKAILSPELLQVLQDASNMQKVRRLLTASHGAHPTESIDVTIEGRKRRLTLSPVALSTAKIAARG